MQREKLIHRPPPRAAVNQPTQGYSTAKLWAKSRAGQQEGEYSMKLMKFLGTLTPETLIWLCTGDNDETDYIVLKKVHAFKFQEVRGYRVRRVQIKFRP